MGKTIRKKKFVEENVIDAARARFGVLFERFDRVTVSFSGGKDSTVCLHLALEEAERRGRLPLDVAFWDEEAIHPETIEYVERVRANPNVRMKWLCLPVRHRNACSRKEPFWYPWDPDARDRWCRPLPEGAITSTPGFAKGASMPEAAPLIYGPESGSVADVRGLRADESVRRYQAVAKKLRDNWIANPEGHFWRTSPIYDWTVIDVWTAPRLFGWDYNRTYDLFAMAGISPAQQRVCPPFGEEPLATLPLYAICWPDLWSKMVQRVHGAATAARYARTELYGYGSMGKPKGLSWREWCMRQLDLYPERYRRVISGNIRRLIALQKERTNRSIPDIEADPLTGLSWQFLAMVAMRGDMKGRKVQMLTTRGSSTLRKRGLVLEDVSELDMGTRY